MAGGHPWTEEEEAFIVRRVADDQLTNEELVRAYNAKYGAGKRTANAIAKRRGDLYGRVKARRRGDWAAGGRPTPEDIARHASGQAVPGVYDGPAVFEDWEVPEDVDWREWFDSFETVQDLYRRIDPSQEILTVNLQRAESPVCIAFGSDFHLGGGYTSHKAIRDTVELILETDGVYLATIGDLIEGFIPGEKSAETVEQMAGSLKAQLAALRSLVQEFVDRQKILCMSWGDHDAKWFEKLLGLNIVKSSFHDRVPYFNGRGLIRLLVGEQEYFVQINHAERFASQWNLNHPQRRQFERFFPADVNVSGHRHKPAFQMFHHYDQLRDAGVNLGGKTWLVACGTYKTGPDPYTVRSWTRGIIGVPTGVFHHHRHDVDMLESPDKAIAFRAGLLQ